MLTSCHIKKHLIFVSRQSCKEDPLVLRLFSKPVLEEEGEATSEAHLEIEYTFPLTILTIPVLTTPLDSF
jgi:hypothetical protein